MLEGEEEKKKKEEERSVTLPVGQGTALFAGVQQPPIVYSGYPL